MEQQKRLLHIFVSTISQLIKHRNLKILGPTPHNTQGIMLGRDKNFQVLMLYELRNRENKKYARDVFAVPPFSLRSVQYTEMSLIEVGRAHLKASCRLQ